MDLDGTFKILSSSSEQELFNNLNSALSAIGIASFGYFFFAPNESAPEGYIGTSPKKWFNRNTLNDLSNKMEHNIIKGKTTALSSSTSIDCRMQDPFHLKINEIESVITQPILSGHLKTAFLCCQIDLNNVSQWLAKYHKHLAVNANAFHFRLENMPSKLANNQLKHKISKRELECGYAICSGNTLRQVGALLNITERTVRFHLENLKQKLQAKSKEEVIAKLIYSGLVRL